MEWDGDRIVYMSPPSLLDVFHLRRCHVRCDGWVGTVLPLSPVEGNNVALAMGRGLSILGATPRVGA